jgi:hypothetical protein
MPTEGDAAAHTLCTANRSTTARRYRAATNTVADFFSARPQDAHWLLAAACSLTHRLRTEPAEVIAAIAKLPKAPSYALPREPF